MEHRKFLQRLDELVVELTHAQAQKVIAALQQRGEGDEVQRILEQRLEDDPKCPHCGSRRITRRAQQLALAFEAFQKKDLVNLRDASKRLILRLVLRLQKTMAPLEGSVLVDVARLGGLAHRQRLIERPGKAEPALLLAQPRQRRPGQRIEGALAIKAAAARQAVPLPAPAFN